MGKKKRAIARAAETMPIVDIYLFYFCVCVRDVANMTMLGDGSLIFFFYSYVIY